MPDRAELRGLLARLVACDSANPPGREAGAAALVQRELASWGVASRLLEFAPGRTSLHAELPGERPGAIVLTGHLDTVAAAPAWRTPPLTLQPRGERLYGLGACDMKGGVAMLLHGLRQVVRHGGTPRHALRLLLTADEEDAYRGARQLAGAGLLADARFVVVGEPSAGRVLHGERGAFWVRAHFAGREAHGSTPQEGVSAILACSRFLAALEARMAEAPALPWFGPATWNPGRIEGGRQPNIVAESCHVELDFRIGAAAERERLAALLDEEGGRAATSIGATFRRELLSYLPPLLAEPGEPLVGRFCRAFAAATGREPELGVAPYCTDLPALFPETTPPPFVIFGPGDIRQAHQPDEFLREAELYEAGDVLSGFLLGELFG